MENTYLVFTWLMASAFILPAMAMVWIEVVPVTINSKLEYSILLVEEMQYDYHYGDTVVEEKEDRVERIRRYIMQATLGLQEAVLEEDWFEASRQNRLIGQLANQLLTS